jgi:hypothetical protein
MGQDLSHTEITSQKKQFEFEITHVPEIDEILNRVTKVFSDYEGYRIKLQERLKKANQLAGTQNEKNSCFAHPFKILLSAISAGSQGNIRSVLQYSTEGRVRLRLKKTKDMTESTGQLFQLLDEFMDIYNQTVNLGPEMCKKISSLLREVSDLQKDLFARKYTAKNFVSRREFDRAIELNEYTYLSLNKELIIWNKLHLALGNEYRGIVQKLDDLIDGSNVVGSQASQQGIHEPREIFQKCGIHEK